MTGCFRIPLSLEDAEAIIVACSGQAEWRPVFLMGLGSAALFVFLLVGVLLTVRALR